MSETEPPLAPGAFADSGGVRFTLVSERAEAVELCLFDGPGDATASSRVALDRKNGGIWTVRLPDIAAGQLYGYRVDGPWAPARGDRFNPAKLLVDPWARALTGEPRWERSTLGPDRQGGGDDGPPDSHDSAAAMPKAIVVAPADGDRPPRPRIPWRDTVIYECHVKGMTRLHPEVPEELRGTYLGLATPAVIDHLRGLGVTAVELLPIQQFASEPPLVAAGLSNYFGYNPLALCAPHAGWASAADGRQVDEVREMVDRLHAAGLEVILDVVFNHTAEGGNGGPTLSWRGLDNRGWYRLDPDDPARYIDHSGCGNSLDASRPAVRRLVLDALRHWAGAIGVDGFRFDLAVSLGRDREGRFAPAGSLLEEIAADPALAGCKLIAEPWDLGPEGHRVGRFPEPWREWNDRYRDAVRSFWRGDRGRGRRLAAALDGSRELFARHPAPASIDFVTCHDGFTLADLVSYERKHNEANLEGNRDGSAANHSRNWGTEGPTADAAILDRRARVRRSLLATLALGAGVPMLGHGDELGRSQQGNNNAYCHDSELTWVDWRLDGERRGLLAFCRRLLRLRRELGLGAAARQWLAADGTPMTAARWQVGGGHAVGARLAGTVGDLLALLNGGETAVLFQLPPPPPRHRWRRRLSTADPEAPPRPLHMAAVRLQPHTLLLLDAVATSGDAPAAAQPATEESSRSSQGSSSSSSPSSTSAR